MIPYAVDASFDRRPVVNWMIVVGIILVFILQVMTSEEQASKRPTFTGRLNELKLYEERTSAEQVVEDEVVTGPMARFALDGWGPLGLFGHNWLHANVIHLIANLLFLWAFGNAVCARIGNKPYLGVYLGFCLLGGIIHLLVGLLVDVGPAFGAGVALSGIVGMYLVFFPENTISCFFLVPHPVTFDIAGCFFIVVWLIVDILVALFHVPSVTYPAHVLGFGGGVGLAVLMLKKKWVVMEKDEKSLLGVLKRAEQEVPTEEEGESKDTRAAEKAPEKPSTTEKAAPEKAVMEAKMPKDEFIRFYCQCGKRIKVPKEHAGAMGLCPRCKRQVKVPER